MKKGVKIGLIIAAIPLLVAGVVYYVLVHNLEEVLSFAVEKQTNGQYAFHSRDFRISLLDKTVIIDHSVLTRKDTTNTPVYYELKIPKAYLSIEDWNELFRHKRLLIDSFWVERPGIVVHDYRVRQKASRQASFHTSMILENLQRTLDRLHAKSIAIHNASFTLFTRRGAQPLAVRDVSLTVRNFSKIDNNDRHLFGSDNIELALGRQRLRLADGKNSLSFSALRFASKTQTFEIDSVYFLQPATAERGETSLRADKFLFNSSHIPTIYQKSILSLDTLVCVRPILRLPLTASKKTGNDTSIHASLKDLFTFIDIGYTQIKDGQVVLGNNPAKRSGTEQANLAIHHLRIDPRRDPILTTDSINLNLNNITFFSKDSLSKITVASFKLRNKDVLFNQVRYSPASASPDSKGLTFAAPTLRLRGVDLNQLIRSQLVASEADLVEPTIGLIATRKPPGRPVIAANHDTIVHKKTDIYQTLKRFGGLIQVDKFRVINGSGQYQLVGATRPVKAQLKKLNATLLVKKLLASEALIDIKHAIPDLRIGEMAVASPNVTMRLANYRMDGAHRHNWVDGLKIDLASGTSLTADKLYWEAFSWDIFQQTNVIQIDQVTVQQLAIAAFIKPKSTSAVLTPAPAATQPKGLPKLRIGRLLAQRMTLNADLPNQTTAGFQGQGIQMDHLTSDPRYFHWSRLVGKLTDLFFTQNEGKQVRIGQIALHSHQNTTMTNVHYADNKAGKRLEVTVPTLQLNGPFPSTDVSTLSLTSLAINQPSLTLETQANDNTAGAAANPTIPFAIPLNLALQELKVNGATVNVVTKKKNRTTKLQTTVDIEARSLLAKKHEAATFALWQVSPSNIKLETPTLNTDRASGQVQLTNGTLSATRDGKPTLRTHLTAKITLHDIHPKLGGKPGKTPAELRTKTVEGDINLPDFQWTAGQKLAAWPFFLKQASVTISGLSVKTAKSAIEAEKARWSGQEERLALHRFSVTPTMTKEAFISPPNRQADYIRVTGDLAQLTGLNTQRWYRDSTLIVRHVVVKNVVTDVSRDKRLPDPAVMPDKPMPTRLLSAIRVPFRIDSVSVMASQVNYHETSKVTDRVGTIPLHAISGLLTTLTNRPQAGDSLKLLASTRLLDLDIQRLFYRESYTDSLSGFRLSLNTSDLQLPTLTALTNPMAAVDLDGGYLEPITAQLAGNKYASVGNLRFHYNGLKLTLLGHKDTTRRSLLIRFENFAASTILRKNNARDARIFYDRDQKKFIFGYWIKSLVSGVLVSVGVKANKRYHANYLKLSQQHVLPSEDD